MWFSSKFAVKRVLCQFMLEGIFLNGRSLDVKYPQPSSSVDSLSTELKTALLNESILKHKLLKGNTDWMSVSPSASDITCPAYTLSSGGALSIKPNPIPDSEKGAILNAAVRVTLST